MRKDDFLKLTKEQQLQFRLEKKLYFRKYRAQNKEKTNTTSKVSRLNRKINVFKRYGGCICKWCCEKDTTVLAIDHINNDGKHHRPSFRSSISGISLYNWLKKNNYPSGYQVLCFNCNWAKELNNGVLPENRKNKYYITPST